ncbi:MAG TPA: NUDIX hydrolase [Pyrinomonadaceae bacterium]|nr:NUDIX hydrolase [Pyrinomonadaceae bacterium]
MLKRMLAGVWLSAPRFVRRAGVWLAQPRFAVTAGAVVRDERGRVLLLRHTLRKGSGWGIPGGFMLAGEQPEEAVRRELREETGLEVESVELAFVRTLKSVRQVEVVFRGLLRADAIKGIEKNFEIDGAEWFATDAMPHSLSADQRRVIARALAPDSANARE